MRELALGYAKKKTKLKKQKGKSVISTEEGAVYDAEDNLKLLLFFYN